MKIDLHLRNIRESVEEIEHAIQVGITKRQRTIGFHASSAAADMFEIILHKENLIDPGFIVKHEWFASANKMKEKFAFSFKGKEEFIRLAREIEAERNKLCYGRPQPEESIAKVLENFNTMKKLFEELSNEKL